jgi:uncharacterized membrane protein YkvA (DUF1232 family)
VWWLAFGILGVLAALWAAFVAVLLVTRPDGTTVRDTARLLPDTVRLTKRLATDRTIPLRKRLPVWFLVAYLASPIDVIPDFLPVIGYADDAILTALVLRHLIRRAGSDKLTEHWPGSAEGLAQLRRILRLRAPT